MKQGAKSESPTVPSLPSMANLPRKMTKIAQQHSGFRHIPNVEVLSTDELTQHGLYRGYPCAHGHDIRSLDTHWCYKCATKIRDNICGFDLNYLHGDYKHKYASLWSQIAVGDPGECWEAPQLTKKRVCMPSYRSLYTKDKSGNISAQKAIYHCAWGDVGSMFVTRTCGNKSCLNPLHLVSSWNRLFPPSTISPFDCEFKPEKLMQFAHSQSETQVRLLRERQYKRTIQHPLVNQNCPVYDDIYR